MSEIRSKNGQAVWRLLGEIQNLQSEMEHIAAGHYGLWRWGVRIEIGRFYKTRNGQKVRIYALDGYMDEAIHGAIYEDITIPILRLQGWNFEGHVVSQELHDDNIVDEWRAK